MKQLVLSLLCLVVLTPATRAENIESTAAIKTNLLYDATLTVNLGAELRVAPKWTIDLSGNINSWTLSNGRRWRHWMIQPEARRWTKEAFRGHFFAGHLFGGQFNYSFDGRQRRQGWAAGLGVGYGYAWQFGRRWGLEAEIAVGYTRYSYDKYPCTNCGRVIASHNKNYFGPTKAAINLVYRFGPEPKKVMPAVIDIPYVNPADSGSFKMPVWQPSFKFILVETPSTVINRSSLSGSADIKFRTSKTDIDPTYLDNTAELAKIDNSIDSIQSLSNVEITGVWIKGYASPDGPYATNARLAAGRTQSIRDYLLKRHDFPSHIIVAESEPENWAGLLAAVEGSSLPHRDMIVELINSNLKPDSKEKRLREDYPQDFDYIRDNILPLLRQTAYRVDYAHYYKTEELSALHDVNTAIGAGDYTRATELLDKLPRSGETIYARGVVAAMQIRLEEALDLFEEARELGVNQADDAIRQVCEAIENMPDNAAVK